MCQRGRLREFEYSIARQSADGQSVGIVLTARTAGKAVLGADDALEGSKPASASSGKPSDRPKFLRLLEISTDILGIAGANKTGCAERANRV
jgi:hypothetical protein